MASESLQTVVNELSNIQDGSLDTLEIIRKTKTEIYGSNFADQVGEINSTFYQYGEDEDGKYADSQEWKFINTYVGMINVESPYYKAMTGKIALTPELFELFVPPASASAGKEYIAKLIEERKKRSGKKIHGELYRENFIYGGWTKKQLRNAIRKSSGRPTWALITKNKNDNAYLPGFGKNIYNRDVAYKAMPPEYYQQLYRIIFETENVKMPTLNQLIDRKLLTDSETESVIENPIYEKKIELIMEKQDIDEIENKSVSLPDNPDEDFLRNNKYIDDNNKVFQKLLIEGSNKNTRDIIRLIIQDGRIQISDNDVILAFLYENTYALNFLLSDDRTSIEFDTQKLQKNIKDLLVKFKLDNHDFAELKSLAIDIKKNLKWDLRRLSMQSDKNLEDFLGTKASDDRNENMILVLHSLSNTKNLDNEIDETLSDIVFNYNLTDNQLTITLEKIINDFKVMKDIDVSYLLKTKLSKEAAIFFKAFGSKALYFGRYLDYFKTKFKKFFSLYDIEQFKDLFEFS